MGFKELAWSTFMNTGNVNTYLMMKELELQEQGIINNNDINNFNNLYGNNMHGGIDGNNKN
jgi:hypothetical protein